MESPLGHTLASFYMSKLENEALSTLQIKPPIYCRYVDDCFVGLNNIIELHSLKNYFEEHSILKFTFELNVKKVLPFLDVQVRRENSYITTAMYSKETKSDECMNYQSIYPLRYNTTVIDTFIHKHI